MLIDKKAQARLNISTATTTEIIPAPGVGRHIQIDHMSFVNSGANNVDFKSATVFIFDIDFAGAATFAFDNASGDYPIVLLDNDAFNIVTSQAVKVQGIVLYRVVGD